VVASVAASGAAVAAVPVAVPPVTVRYRPGVGVDAVRGRRPGAVGPPRGTVDDVPAGPVHAQLSGTRRRR